MEAKQFDWMMFCREKDGTLFVFNGKWPIKITPDKPSWGEDFVVEDKSITAVTEERLPQLESALHSNKRVFTVEKIRYRILERGNFIIL